ncbi:MAG TPA: hypothetical protein VH249_08095 [Xanthobacteraceae bacterium]|jgi:hypothetical protein|nr:hypothetical protein [Xanthobacteraceae bacterium]
MPLFVPPLIGWALGALGAAVLARFVAAEWRRVNDTLHPAEPAPEEVVREKFPTLRRDPRSGVYRPDQAPGR